MMAENDSNIIRPVESLQNISGLHPVRRREQRRRRQNLPGESENEEKTEQEPNEPVETENAGGEPADNKNGHVSDTAKIDYRA